MLVVTLCSPLLFSRIGWRIYKHSSQSSQILDMGNHTAIHLAVLVWELASISDLVWAYLAVGAPFHPPHISLLLLNLSTIHSWHCFIFRQSHLGILVLFYILLPSVWGTGIFHLIYLACPFWILHLPLRKWECSANTSRIKTITFKWWWFCHRILQQKRQEIRITLIL